MENRALFIFSSIPAILYNRVSLHRLHETYVKIGMSLQELSQVLHIKPSLNSNNTKESNEDIQVFEYDDNELEKYIMIFKDGRLNKWYTEIKRTLEE